MSKSNTTRSRHELSKRYGLFIISLFFSALGVAITKRGALGVSPISSTANVLSIRFTMLSLGNWLIIWNGILILGQIVILRKNFQIIQLLQIPLSFLFGYFTDFGMWLTNRLELNFYLGRLSLVIVGTVVLGFGVALSVIADVIMNSGEAFVKAVSDVSQIDFSNVKIIFDISCVVIAVILSVVFFGGKIEGTREGTIIAALFTGIVVKFFLKPLRKPITQILQKS